MFASNLLKEHEKRFKADCLGAFEVQIRILKVASIFSAPSCFSLNFVYSAIFLAVCFTAAPGCQVFKDLFSDEAEIDGESDEAGVTTKKEKSNESDDEKAKVKASDLKGAKYVVEKIDDKTYLMNVGRIEVWKKILDILARDYNLTVVDLKSGIITTDWDRYYLTGTPFRNRITLRTKRLTPEKTKVILNNKVEMLEAGQWLASPDKAGESKRIIGNLARSLGLILPPED